MPPPTQSIPEEAVIGRFSSPAFAGVPPALIGADLIPDEVHALLNGIWSIPRFEEQPVKVLRLHDVWVAKEGLVFDSGGALYQETITQHSVAEIEAAHTAVEAARADGTERDEDGPVVLCKKRGVGNYGHWLIEMLPKAHLLRTRMPDLDARVLIAEAEGRLAESMALSLDRLGFASSRIIAAGDEPRRFAELLVVEGLSCHGIHVSPLILESIDALASGIPPSPYGKLLVLRRSTGFRMLTEEDAVIAEALNRGFAVIEPGLLPLPEQIALFKGAERIVGIMGAAMTNIVFARPGVPVFTLAPATMADTFFWFLSVLRGLDYTEVRCPQSGPVRGNSLWDTDLTLDPALYDRVFGPA